MNLHKKTDLIVIANQKGGCGKTTTCINLSACLANNGFKVLMIDLDPQSHASLGIGIDTDNLTHSIYEVLVQGVEMERAATATYLNNLDIVPATSLLTGAQLEIADLLGREGILRTAINRMLNTNAKEYDYIVMDCSPSLNLLTINGLTAAGFILVPIQTHYFSLEGMKELMSTIKIVKERLNFELEILGILPTLFDIRTRMNRGILQEIKEYFKEKVFKTVIHMNIRLAEASAHKKSIFEYDPSSIGAQNYLSLAEEVVSLTKPQFSIKKEETSGKEQDVKPPKEIIINPENNAQETRIQEENKGDNIVGN
jgi:chromosome partitioning protein